MPLLANNLFWGNFGMVLIIQLLKLVQESSKDGCTADQVLELTTPKPADAVTTQNNLFLRIFLLEWY
jgi:hypothetical protein